ncbi:Pimeloyl-ACP methyl ester carboxylesterase [Roseivivax lentus]|uniref:Pimeloyl-ACP methyl ester carboxylesterase n=1 Tax=Roseivivax lentus TaxID=633194 RepID=A0A1N7KV56_9RHOB|nr:alpha/beta fold hydrolase [Roseivivax lentus]SIS65444.1 Pimeloyl-ACP methyl ester carboxylesterase [Roseivivax lentus]
MLNTIRHGDSDLPPLVIVHGLYGQAKNWTRIARALSDIRHVVAVDQRNHGASLWADSHGYEDMAADLAHVIEELDRPADVVGHSMGGKAAMMLSLTRPDMVRRLVSADMAPVAYDHDHQSGYIDAMKSVDLDAVSKRSDAAAQLAAHVDDPVLQGFFTQSLDLKEKRWLLNLDVLGAEMPKILGWPAPEGRFEGPALFLSGGKSDYVTPEMRGPIRDLFPRARFARIADAGHWLHAEKPEAFEATLRAFLTAEA